VPPADLDLLQGAPAHTSGLLIVQIVELITTNNGNIRSILRIM
jgi:hypothetical protein